LDLQVVGEEDVRPCQVSVDYRTDVKVSETLPDFADLFRKDEWLESWFNRKDITYNP
jgi:hypothetical protein